MKILRTAGASLSLRGEGPHQLPQKRSLALVSILQSLAGVEIADALHSRDFRSPAIFEFFNTIGAKRTVVRSATCGVARSHLDRHLAVLAEIRLFAGQPGLGELEGSNGSARRSIPQFRREGLDPQQAYVGIVRAARPPHLIGLSPGRLCLFSIANDAGAAGDR